MVFPFSNLPISFYGCFCLDLWFFPWNHNIHLLKVAISRINSRGNGNEQKTCKPTIRELLQPNVSFYGCFCLDLWPSFPFPHPLEFPEMVTKCLPQIDFEMPIQLMANDVRWKHRFSDAKLFVLKKWVKKTHLGMFDETIFYI